MKQSRLIAITGGIGSGKSSACVIVKNLGFPVLDCDKIAKEISYSPSITELISLTFGEKFIFNGALNRKELRSEVFADKQKYQQLNDIFFEKTIEELLKQVEKIPESTIFVEVSAYKPSLDSIFTQVWLVDAPLQVRLNRVRIRDEVEMENILNIMNNQIMPIKPTKIINNDGTIEQLAQQVEYLVFQLDN
ncbi:MAG: dephospho-CoA kinase [Clostridia bacterium]